MFGNLARVVLACWLAVDADPLFLRQLELFDLRLAGLVFAGEVHGAQVGQVGGEGEGGEGSPGLLHHHDDLVTFCLHHISRLSSPPATSLLTAGQLSETNQGATRQGAESHSQSLTSSHFTTLQTQYQHI